MNIVIFDTETTGLNKPYCYNIGYLILNTDTNEILLEKDFVVEQIWHNLALFNTAYYADKRPLYVAAMRSKKTKMEKYGYIMQEMKRTFKFFNVEYAFAYNSNFDEKVFDFNCDWFKCQNPFDDVPIRDIRKYVLNTLKDNENFKKFCDTNELYTDSGNYSTTAETVYKFITNNTEFEEAHTALADSQIEAEILKFFTEYQNFDNTEISSIRSIEKVLNREITITKNKKVILTTTYNKIRINKDKTQITLTE